jgi:hypothetical protein
MEIFFASQNDSLFRFDFTELCWPAWQAAHTYVSVWQL